MKIRSKTGPKIDRKNTQFHVGNKLDVQSQKVKIPTPIAAVFTNDRFRFMGDLLSRKKKGYGHTEFIYIIFNVSSLFSAIWLPIYHISFWNYDKKEETGLLLFR